MIHHLVQVMKVHMCHHGVMMMVLKCVPVGIMRVIIMRQEDVF